MRLVGILGLLLGWLLAHGPPAKAGQPAIADIQITSAIVIDATMQFVIGRLLSQVSNDNHPELDNKTWVGFQMQGPCTKAGSQVPGGAGLPCVPNNEFPAFGAGLQKITGLTQRDCDYKALQGAKAIQGTTVPIVQALGLSGVPFPPREEVGYLTPGGICDGGGTLQFVGNLRGTFMLGNPHGISDVTCLWLLNMCSGTCSCGTHFVPN